MPLVWFEGGDGTGKGTQMAMAEQELLRRDCFVRTYREPGGDEIGELLRSVLKADSADQTYRVLAALLEPGQSYHIEPRTEIMLFCAVRTQIAPKIREWLDAGDWVLADRSWISTMAYQVHGRGLEADYDVVRMICKYAIGSVEPDLVLVFDIPEEVAKQRRGNRRSVDRIEAEGDEFMQRVMGGYRLEAERAGYPVVDAQPSAEAVFRGQVWPRIQELLQRGS